MLTQAWNSFVMWITTPYIHWKRKKRLAEMKKHDPFIYEE